MLPSICPFDFLVGGIKEPSMYMHRCGGFLFVGGGGEVYVFGNLMV